MVMQYSLIAWDKLKSIDPDYPLLHNKWTQILAGVYLGRVEMIIFIILPVIIAWQLHNFEIKIIQ